MKASIADSFIPVKMNCKRQTNLPHIEKAMLPVLPAGQPARHAVQISVTGR